MLSILIHPTRHNIFLSINECISIKQSICITHIDWTLNAVFLLYCGLVIAFRQNMHFKAKPTCGRISSWIKFYSSRITNAINFSPLVWNILHSLGMTKAVLFLFSTYSCCFTFSKTMLYIQLKRIALFVLREVQFFFAVLNSR